MRDKDICLVVAFDPNLVKFGLMLELKLALNNLLRAEGQRSGLETSLEHRNSHSYTISRDVPFDTSGSEFQLFDERTETRETSTYHISRDEVYGSIQRLAKPRMAEQIISDLSERYPDSNK